MKRLSHIVFLCMLLVATPMAAMTGELLDGPEQETTTVTVHVKGNRVRVSSLGGEVLTVYNIAGVCVGTFSLDNADKTVEIVLGRGCYIFKVGTVVRKVSVR
ncbi:MAG: T9SS type A sorting domain-containing protein [Bacteroidales bacterium]|nr:T9SS type A sorting domain-containing protein [Candidatus Physcousia equi]